MCNQNHAMALEFLAIKNVEIEGSRTTASWIFNTKKGGGGGREVIDYTFGQADKQ